MNEMAVHFPWLHPKLGRGPLPEGAVFFDPGVDLSSEFVRWRPADLPCSPAEVRAMLRSYMEFGERFPRTSDMQAYQAAGLDNFYTDTTMDIKSQLTGQSSPKRWTRRICAGRPSLCWPWLCIARSSSLPCASRKGTSNRRAKVFPKRWASMTRRVLPRSGFRMRIFSQGQRGTAVAESVAQPAAVSASWRPPVCFRRRSAARVDGSGAGIFTLCGRSRRPALLPA